MSFPPIVPHVPDWHVGQCQSGTWRKVGSGELQITTAQATGWRFPGATATCPTGKRVTGG
ncbi:shufflon protein B, partial [Salmonella enterica subsp. enterica serovar Anatum]